MLQWQKGAYDNLSYYADVKLRYRIERLPYKKMWTIKLNGKPLNDKLYATFEDARYQLETFLIPEQWR